MRRLANRSLLVPRIYGPSDRLHIAPTAAIHDNLFNLSSGHITIGEWAMLGHGAAFLTGTHDFTKFNQERHLAVPQSGRDIVVGEGAWIATNAVILGPCHIGEHSVVAAGALVRDDVPPYTLVVGVPARIIGDIPH
jgi:acetyltransferase-like isoleucine patch superfamily enzyme